MSDNTGSRPLVEPTRSVLDRSIQTLDEPKAVVSRELGELFSERRALLRDLVGAFTTSQDVNGQEMRDPFSASAEERRQELADVAGNGEGPDKSRPPELLEKYPLDGLSMVGTLGIGDAIEGLVKDPEGVVHRVHKDNYLGQNYGRITTIAEDRIELVELVPNGAGGWMERQASIALGDQ